MLAHNLVLAIIIFYLLDIQILHLNPYTIPQFIFAMINLFWIALVVAVVSTRYRDVNPIVTNTMQLFFYLTPIIWMIDQIKENTIINGMLSFNPFFYIITAFRGLLDGSIMNQTQLSILVIMASVGLAISFWIFSASYKRIAYWL